MAPLCGALLSWLEDMSAAPVDTIAEPKRRGFHWIIAGPLSLWCLAWLALNGYNYLHLTWRIFATLRWLSFALLINPCFAHLARCILVLSVGTAKLCSAAVGKLRR